MPKNPKCSQCKDNFFAFDYKAGLCVQCAPLDFNGPAYVPGANFYDRARYADMDKMADLENGEI